MANYHPILDIYLEMNFTINVYGDFSFNTKNRENKRRILLFFKTRELEPSPITYKISILYHLTYKSNGEKAIILS